MEMRHQAAKVIQRIKSQYDVHHWQWLLPYNKCNGDSCKSVDAEVCQERSETEQWELSC